MIKAFVILALYTFLALLDWHTLVIAILGTLCYPLTAIWADPRSLSGALFAFYKIAARTPPEMPGASTPTNPVATSGGQEQRRPSWLRSSWRKSSRTFWRANWGAANMLKRRADRLEFFEKTNDQFSVVSQDVSGVDPSKCPIFSAFAKDERVRPEIRALIDLAVRRCEESAKKPDLSGRNG